MASRVRNQLQALKKVYPWISTPLIISAPMRVFAGPALAVAVTKAGGIGFIGPGASPPDLDIALTESRRLLEQSSASSHSSMQPVGIGLQTFDADLGIAIQAIREHKPYAVWLFAPRDGQSELNTWVQSVKDSSPETQIWIQVGSVMDALSAARAPIPPDVLVIQGSDAGGHGLARGAGFISILPEVADELRDTNILLMAAGGIADGRGVAAALSLGAAGAVMGTRFLASEEAKIPRGYQEDVLKTSDGSQNTIRTKLYDELAGRTDWPSMYDGRNIRNRSTQDQESGLSFAENEKLYKKALTKGNDGWGENGRLTAYVGAGVGLVREVTAACTIVTTTTTSIITTTLDASKMASKTAHPDKKEIEDRTEKLRLAYNKRDIDGALAMFVDEGLNCSAYSISRKSYPNMNKARFEEFLLTMHSKLKHYRHNTISVSGHKEFQAWEWEMVWEEYKKVGQGDSSDGQGVDGQEDSSDAGGATSDIAVETVAGEDIAVEPRKRRRN
ncbi:Nitronate monooxygenase [Lachnellula suecica]|uniref:Nitronate monooxygenase n=1 Tax=Lachnellula suecica TaxID=602035 RepID=A0A8T9CH61_9HELO|nr:Nitronate monooxygenase [Lachnellula suecica]